MSSGIAPDYTIEEAFESGSLAQGSEKRGERVFLVFGVEYPQTSSTEADVMTAVVDFAPTTFDSMPLRVVSVEPVSNTIWKATAAYSPTEDSPPPEYSGFLTTFSTTGATERVYTAIDQGRLNLTSENPLDAVDYGLQVNVSNDGEVQGVDIVVPRMEFNETHFIADSTVTDAYIKTLANMTSTVNSSSFRGFDAEEVLFLGASGAKRPAEGDWEITFAFAASPNRNLTVSEILGYSVAYGSNFIPKKGHEFFWVSHEKSTSFDDSGEPTGLITSEPVAAYVSKVYRTADFSALGIG